jgi:ferric-dicitrate binding protein FerR (iron transport regulator)
MISKGKIWRLIGKKDNGSITPGELEELKSLLEEYDSVNATHSFIGAIWEKGFRVSGNFLDKNTHWEGIERALNKKVSVDKKPLRLFRPLMVAALLSIVLVAGLYFYRQVSSGKPVYAMGEDNHVFAQPGSRPRLILPDGTKVWLNAGSELSYGDFKDTRTREVTLKGEGMFNVIHDASRPFIVHTAKVNIRDIGTRFVVKAYPGDDQFEATLIEGAIEVIDRGNSHRKILLKPSEKVVIDLQRLPVPSQDRRQSREGPPSGNFRIGQVKKDSHGLIPETAWVQNKLVFSNEPFGELAKRMERWYNVRIHFEDERIKQTSFSGVIEKETLEQALNAMQFSSPFSYRMEGDNIWIGHQ